jgi:cytochrome b
LAIPDRRSLLPVWDFGVRLFHWLLVVGVAVAAVTGFLMSTNWLTWHITAGSIIGTLIIARLIWGMTGSTYSRFSNFTLSPSAVIEHLQDIRHKRIHREGGHNALGSWMVVALLIILSGLTLTGLTVLGGMFKQGPGKSLFSFANGRFLREPHQWLAWILLALVAAHIAGVIFESLRSQENLAASMITGNKRQGFAPARHAFTKQGLAAMSAAIIAAIALTTSTLYLNAAPPKGIQVIAVNASWKEECSACHANFHPTLLPAKSWELVMHDLSNHFGEDASISGDKTNEILAFLTANSAETSDSFPANVFRNVAADHPMEITQTQFWKRRHSGISDATFALQKIKAKQNCAACHSDAESGNFAPQNILIPQEAQ